MSEAALKFDVEDREGRAVIAVGQAAAGGDARRGGARPGGPHPRPGLPSRTVTANDRGGLG